MNELGTPDSHHLNAAQGWLELGNHSEANEELAKISASLVNHPEVLEVRWAVHAAGKRWPTCVEVAETLVKVAPDYLLGWIHRSYALHELKRTREAFNLLLPAVELFPEEPLIRYNLACYCCQLEEAREALEWLDKALVLGDYKQFKQMALEDPDLQPLKAEILKLAKPSRR
jgi:tetratricopeptide (TPR) repeat protein